MASKYTVFLLSGFIISAASLDNTTNYLRKLKKDKAGKDDKGVISAEVIKTFDISENGLGFGDWMRFYDVNSTTERIEAAENHTDAIEDDYEMEAIDVEYFDSALGYDMDAMEDDTNQPTPAPESTDSTKDTAYPTSKPIGTVNVGFDNSVSDESFESVDIDTPAPVASPEVSSVDAAQEEVAWNHGATSVSSRRSGTITFKIPDTTHIGDTLFLFLSRTDGVLPLNLPGWNRGAECFKSNNRQQSCMRAVHCIERDGPYCRTFKKDGATGNGKDLATVVFYRHVEEDDPCEWTLNLAGGTTTWAIVVSIPNVNREKPIQRAAGTSCDRKKQSIFPSVYGDQGNIVLLSQSFDDTAVLNQFRPPQGTEVLEWTNDLDEAGFVYGKKLDEAGLTGKLATEGNGGPLCKDALLSLVINID